jgi:fucose permease
MQRVLRPDVPTLAKAAGDASPHFMDALKNRNVIFNALGMCCYLGTLIRLAAFMPNYLTDHLGLGRTDMGKVLAGAGQGSFAGIVLLPALSDRVGRKPLIVVALLIQLAMIWYVSGLGAEVGPLFIGLFVLHFVNVGVVAIKFGPLTSGSVAPALATTATGFVVGIAEIVGGAVVPACAGGLADQMGISVVLTICLVAIGLSVPLALFGLQEVKSPMSAQRAADA